MQVVVFHVALVADLNVNWGYHNARLLLRLPCLALLVLSLCPHRKLRPSVLVPPSVVLGVSVAVLISLGFRPLAVVAVGACETERPGPIAIPTAKLFNGLLDICQSCTHHDVALASFPFSLALRGTRAVAMRCDGFGFFGERLKRGR